MEIEEIKKDLKNLLSESRYLHSLRVAEVAKELAGIYGYDENKAYLTGLVHDIAKEFTQDQNQEILRSNGFYQENEKQNPRIIHSIVGSLLLKEKYHLDTDICHAVYSHTTGDIPMNLLDKIIFVADKIEPNKQYIGVEEERQLASLNLNQAIILCMENNHKKLLQEGKKIAPKSILVLKYLKKNK